jgi:hypothetical protein
MPDLPREGSEGGFKKGVARDPATPKGETDLEPIGFLPFFTFLFEPARCCVDKTKTRWADEYNRCSTVRLLYLGKCPRKRLPRFSYNERRNHKKIK